MPAQPRSRTGRLRMLRGISLLASAASLSACLFSEDGDPGRPTTHFDFSRLDSLEHPLSRWYGITKEKSRVGITFAFGSVSYHAEVDTNIAAFQRETGRVPALAGARSYP